MTPLRSTVVDVDLDAVAANLQAVGAGHPAIAVVKADAYGHGAEVVSRALVEAGAIALGVFTVEEGLVLRRSAIEAPILVLGGLSDPGEADAAVGAGLSVAVWDERAARALDEAARMAGARALVQVKVDTGLTRLGAPAEQALERYARISALPALDVEGIFTHFASADVPGDTTAREQAELFARLVRALPERPRLVHASNSAAAVVQGAGPECNALRPGIALYGLNPAPHLASIELRPALRWTSRIQRIVKAQRGTGVGYGHEYRLPREGLVATVPVGYGDGLQRAARHAAVLVRGARVPIAGRVAMDLITLDVTGLHGVREGDEVVLIGEQGGARVSAEDLAEAAGTNNYEVVTALRRLMPRRYFRGGRLVATRTLAGGVAWA